MFKFNLCVLALVLGFFVQLSVQVIPVPAAVKAYSSSRMERLHHNIFHNTRLSWYLLNQTEQRGIARLGWEPPRPAKAFKKDGTEIDIYGDAGEDFLFMHRRMIEKVNKVSADAGDTWVVDGWDNCPAPGDTEWPVSTFDTGFPEFNDYLNSYKTDDFYYNTIVPAEAWLKNDDNLRTLTLGELGVKLEFELHTWFHVRFTGPNPVGYRTQSTHPTEIIDTKWDNPEYNFLGDFYSAHNNPYFWKIHGWIEKKIAAWQAANGIDTITWVGTWEGGPMTDAIFTELEQVAADATKVQLVVAEDDDSTPVVGIVLGCVLGGLALILAFTLILVWMLKGRFVKQSKYVAKSETQPNQALPTSSEQQPLNNI